MSSKYIKPLSACVVAIGVSAGFASLVTHKMKTVVVAQVGVPSAKHNIGRSIATFGNHSLGRMPLQPFFVKTLALLNGKEISMTCDPRDQWIEGGTAFGEIDALTLRPRLCLETLEIDRNLMSIELRDAAPAMVNLGKTWLGIAYPGRAFDVQPMKIVELKIIVSDERGAIIESRQHSPDVSTMFKIPLTDEDSNRVAAARERQTLSLEAFATIPVRPMKAASRLWEASSTVIRRYDALLTDANGPGPCMSNSEAQKVVEQVQREITDTFRGSPELTDLLSSNPLVVTDLFESPSSFDKLRDDQREMLWKRLERTWGSRLRIDDRADTKGGATSESTGSGRMAFGIPVPVPVFAGGADTEAKVKQTYEEVGVRMRKHEASDYWIPAEFAGKLWSVESFRRSLRAKSQALIPNGPIESEEIALGVIPAYLDYPSVIAAIERAEFLDSQLTSLLEERDALSDKLRNMTADLLEHQRVTFRDKRRHFEEVRQKWLEQTLVQVRLAEGVARYQQSLDLWGDWGGKFSGCRDATEMARVEHFKGLVSLEAETKQAEGFLSSFESQGLARERISVLSKLVDELKKHDEKIRAHHLNYKGASSSTSQHQDKLDDKKGKLE